MAFVSAMMCPHRWRPFDTAHPASAGGALAQGRPERSDNERWRRVEGRYLIIGIISVLVVSSGCAGVSPVQVGQTAGTIVGAAVAPGVGPPLGALVGLMAGMLVQGEVDKVTEKHERKILGEELATGPSPAAEGNAPLGAQPTRVWVDETVHNGRLIAGHFDARSLQ